MFGIRVQLSLPAWIQTQVDAHADYAGDDAKMALALHLAAMNVREGSGGPFGAALFDGAGRLLGVGVNRVLPESCSIAHAEMMAFASAQQHGGRFRLNRDGGHVTLATSAQPCAMCYGASFWAGIDAILIAARAEDVQALAGFDEGPLPADWIGEWEKRGIRVTRDLQRERACAILAEYGKSGLVY